MSFLDGKPRIATEQECNASWGGVKGGKLFRCGLCGYKFNIGDIWRCLVTNIPSLGGIYSGNPLICTSCDDHGRGLENWKKHCEEWQNLKKRYWRFIPNCDDCSL